MQIWQFSKVCACYRVCRRHTAWVSCFGLQGGYKGIASSYHRACPTAVFFPERARKKWAWKPIFVLRGALLKTSIKNTSKTTCFGRSFPALTDCHVLLSEIGLQAAFCFSLSSAHSRPLNNHRLWPNTAHANANSRCSKPLLLRGRPRKSFFMIPIRPSVWLRRF